jgi:ABC-type thiamin/hydroxymethylpyrimidine transport system permease subunit
MLSKARLFWISLLVGPSVGFFLAFAYALFTEIIGAPDFSHMSWATYIGRALEVIIIGLIYSYMLGEFPAFVSGILLVFICNRYKKYQILLVLLSGFTSGIVSYEFIEFLLGGYAAYIGRSSWIIVCIMSTYACWLIEWWRVFGLGLRKPVH